MTSEFEYSFPIDITQLPAKGREYELAADAEERARVAARLDLKELSKLEATVKVTPAAGGLIAVHGALHAEVVQECVVTLAPLNGTISEEFDLTFSRATSTGKDDAELELSAEDEEPDVLHGDEIDLGELLVEQLALFIDPYPRAPGAVFENPSKDAEAAEKPVVSPFAVLAKLKTKNKNN